MKRITTFAVLVPLLLLLPSFTLAQTFQDKVDTHYEIARGLVERRIAAIDYSYRGSTNLDFLPTPLLLKAAGIAKIKASNGYTQIEARIVHLESPARYGSEYLTYVLWAISPGSGRANESRGGTLQPASCSASTPTRSGRKG